MSQSTILPLPSSPHWVPTTTIFLAIRYVCSRINKSKKPDHSALTSLKNPLALNLDQFAIAHDATIDDLAIAATHTARPRFARKCINHTLTPLTQDVDGLGSCLTLSIGGVNRQCRCKYGGLCQ